MTALRVVIRVRPEEWSVSQQSVSSLPSRLAGSCCSFLSLLYVPLLLFFHLLPLSLSSSYCFTVFYPLILVFSMYSSFIDF